jgi:diaminopimelate epimerase
MEIKFRKYEGAGNDFILLDNRKKKYNTLTKQQINNLCNRHFGIGADGLILLDKNKEGTLAMHYYNADGGLGSMCGNGSRCFILFALHLGLIKKEIDFLAYDGLHRASVLQQKKWSGIFKISMSKVTVIKKIKQDYFLNTGSPHHVRFTKNVSATDVFAEGKKIRNSMLYKKQGTNVNFAEVTKGKITMRTYERGVENETLACGTGITATAIAAHYAGLLPLKQKRVNVQALGGKLQVEFIKTDDGYSNIFLIGPARFVFEGSIKI